MRVTLQWLAIVILSGLVVVGCKKRVEPAPPKPPPPTHVKTVQTHVVTLDKVQFSEFDFSLTSTGNIMPVKIMLLENGQELAPTSGLATISGQRGERVLDQKIQWLVKVDPGKNYQIVLSEEPPPGETGKRIFIPATPKLGLWPVAENGGHVTFGTESYLEFTDTIAR